MENEIMNNEEIMEGVAEAATTGSRKGLKVAVGAGVTLLVGGIIFKKLIKPAIAKAKAKKEESKAIEATADESECEIDSEESN